MSSASRNQGHLAFTAIAASLSGLLFGFDTAVIAGTTHALTDVFALSPATLGITVSSALWGTIAGAAFSGALSDKVGRRSCLRGLAVIYLVSAVGCAISWNWTSLLIFRIVSGLAIGASSVISPTYIAEIAPPERRGRMVAFFQFNIVVGILLAYLSNYLIGLAHMGLSDWRWKFGAAAIPATLFLFALIRIPESPRWLVVHGEVSRSLTVLREMGSNDPESEVEAIRLSLRDEQAGRSEHLFIWRNRLPIFLAVSIGFFNQASGVNAILYYSNSIFEKAGFSAMSSGLQSVSIGLTNFLALLVAMIFIDRIGRRALLLIGSVGMAICMAGVAYIFQVQRHQSILVWMLIGFIGFFSFSQGSVIWVYLSEIFPNRVRAKGQALGSFTHWAMNAIISAAFPVAAAHWGPLPFWFFSGSIVLQFLVIATTYPETHGVSLESLQQRLTLAD
ncbi:MAG: sugar porter family MFS transporter [Acidobacteriaceae bacterium]|nr:sugar porter family MFS transporter [Acidobacteriaceae bacterium]